MAAPQGGRTRHCLLNEQSAAIALAVALVALLPEEA
jgi:hypothetical protein